MVMPGAFRASLAKRGSGGVKMLFQHDPNTPIGVWLDIREDGEGLFVKGRLTTEVERAREVLSLMRAGALDGLSIGYRTVRGRTDAKTGLRALKEVDLWEISVVTFPMLPEARWSASRSALHLARTIRGVGLVRDAGLTRSEGGDRHRGPAIATFRQAGGCRPVRNSRLRSLSFSPHEAAAAPITPTLSERNSRHAG